MNLFSSRQSKNSPTPADTNPSDPNLSHDTSPESPNKEPETKSEHPFLDLVRFTVIALMIVIPIRMFIAQPFIVSGASMENTFHNGEYLIIDRVSYNLHEPNRGDVVVFRYPKDPSKFFIKRIIGLPGETIQIDGSEVTVFNQDHQEGITLTEPYIKSMAHDNSLTETMRAREYFVMGDNRDESSDSRSWGLLQEDRIIGRVLLRLFPPGKLDVWPGALDSDIFNSDDK